MYYELFWQDFELTEVSGEPEVADLGNAFVGHKDVLRLDVAVQAAL